MNGRIAHYTFRVRFSETDAAGIVFYPNFFMYFDLAMHELLRGAPVDLAGLMRTSGLGFPIRESGGSFSAPLFAEDEITIESQITEVRTRSLRVEHTIRRGSKDIARGFEVRVHARRVPGTDSLEMHEIADELRTWLAGV
ncbi:MAG: hypothetical protein NVSMB5_15390 [Candidatus Velthaea sp.]